MGFVGKLWSCGIIVGFFFLFLSKIDLAYGESDSKVVSSSLTEQRVWPPLEFGWRIVAGTIVGFLGAACGSAGGIGGGGIFIPMFILIVGFDPKSSTAMSKCMIMGVASSSVCYNLKRQHPTTNMPLVDYNLALLIQPMLLLGISIGVALNVIFPYWMVTILLIFIFLGISTKAFFKGIETWKKETIMKREVAFRESLKGCDNGNGEGTITKSKISLFENVCWSQLSLLIFVWVIFLILQIAKNNAETCSVWYWILNLSQIPVALCVSIYAIVNLHTKKWKMTVDEGQQTSLKDIHIFMICLCGILAGVVGGLLGMGGGFILGPLFLELGILPQVSSATATFVMTFSSSMSVVQYYLLNRFPVPYASYFVLLGIFGAFVGQHFVLKLIDMLGRSSLIIFILAFMIFMSALFLGGVGISHMIYKFEHHEYMGFSSLCKYRS